MVTTLRFTQWLQWVRSDRFQMYDYGRRRNLKRYGQETPPEYNVRAIKSRIFIFYGENDFVTVAKV